MNVTYPVMKEYQLLKNNICTDHGNLDGIIHSAAFAPRDHLTGKYLDNVTRDGFLTAHDVSSYSFTALAKLLKTV